MAWLANLIVLSLVFTISAAFPYNHVTVASVIVGNPITVHCFSGDDDLGTHTLAYLQPFSWKFHHNIWGTTKFVCDIYSQYGSGSYTVFDMSMVVNRCGLDCVWQVQAGGPCLQQPREGLYCLPWQRLV